MKKAEGSPAVNALSDPLRLTAVAGTGLLDAPPDETLGRIAHLAAAVLAAPMATLSLVTDSREFYCASAGLPARWAKRREPPGGMGWGRQAVVSARTLSVDDLDAPGKESAPWAEQLGVRAYCATPVRVNSNAIVGALAVADTEPREWTQHDRDVLVAIGELACRELERRIREPRVRRVVNLLPFGIYICDPAGRIGFHNDEAVSLWGTAPPGGTPEADAFAENALLRIDGTELDADELPGVVAARQGAAVTNRELRLRDGRTVFVTAGPILGGDDRVLGSVAVMQDVSELRKAARVKDDLLSLVSHELRTPLTVITGMSRVLRRNLEADGDAELGAVLDDLGRATARLERAVENMLLLSRFEHEAAEPEPLLITAAVSAALARHHRDFPNSRVVVRLSDPRLVILGVPTWVQMILLNLLNNAEQYGDGEAAHIVTADAGETEVRIAICNSGVPQAADAYAAWFFPFYRSPSTPVNVAGAGLGLSVARRLAEAQSGSLDARAWEAQPGTVLTLTLPRVDEAALAS